MTRNYKVWGEQHIDPNSFNQMDAAMSIAPAVAEAIMPDAHVGYGLPIGGVLALDNAVCPYAVGVDIACRIKLSIFEIVRGWACTTRGKAGGNLPATCGDAMWLRPSKNGGCVCV